MGVLKMTNWKPIETAPKDGNRILVISEGGWVSIAQFVEDFEATETEVSGAFLTDGYDNNEPTHWMQFPEPPKVNSL